MTLTTETKYNAGDLMRFEAEGIRRQNWYLICPLAPLPEWAAQLPLSADQFIVDRDSERKSWKIDHGRVSLVQ